MKTLWRVTIFRIKGHGATLNLLFKEPPPVMSWQKIKAMLLACGTDICRGPGNGTLLELNGVRTEIHTYEDKVREPTVRRTCDFLQKAGLTPSKLWSFLNRAGAPS
jgi:hypothetical protein